MPTHPYTRLFPGKTVAPTVDNDSSEGFEVGDIWIDETGGASYQALDVTVGAAVWIAVNEHTHPADEVIMPVAGTPVNTTLTDDFTARGSSGVIDGTLTYVEVDTGDHKIKVAAGEGYLRTSNDQQGALVICEWAAVTQIDIPAPAANQETTRFIGIEYNSGSPQVTVRTTFNWNWYTDFPLARVSYDGSELHILNAYAHAEDTANNIRRYLRLIFPFQRETSPEGSGGLEISSDASQQLAMTAGNAWHGFNRYVMSAITLGTAFDVHYRAAGGGFVNASATQWSNTTYDDGSGTPATLTNNKYACHWIFLDFSDGTINDILGRDQYNNVAAAQLEAVPTTPDHLTYHGRLIGRLIFQKSASSASLIESAWSTLFTPGSTGNHNDLSGLQGGTGGEYYHLTAAEYAALLTFNDPEGNPADIGTPAAGTSIHPARRDHVHDTVIPTLPGGRLSLTTAVPVTTADVTGATTVYYTPYLHNVIELWTGAYWNAVAFSEKSLALGTLTSGLPYDVFGYLDSGTLALEMLAWTNGTTRATGISLQDGRYCKTGDKTRLYLGTFYTTSTTQTEDSEAKRFLFNMYNRRPRSLKVENLSSHNYNVATVRAFNNSQANSDFEYFIGLVEDAVEIMLTGQGSRISTDGNPRISIGVNSTTTELGTYGWAITVVGRVRGGASAAIIPTLGYSFICALEFSTVGTAPGATFEAALLNGIIWA